VRGELDALQSAIEKKYGLIPLFTDEGADGEKNTHSSVAGTGSVSSTGSGPGTASGSLGTVPGVGPGSGPGDAVMTPKQGSENSKSSNLSVTSTDPFSSFLFKSTGTTPYSSGPVPPIER
jgi:hypothetical protein